MTVNTIIIYSYIAFMNFFIFIFYIFLDKLNVHESLINIPETPLMLARLITHPTLQLLIIKKVFDSVSLI